MVIPLEGNMFQCKECSGERFINKISVNSIVRTCVECGFGFNSVDDDDNLKKVAPEPVVRPDAPVGRAKPMKLAKKPMSKKVK
jgi:hypothetical protein